MNPHEDRNYKDEYNNYWLPRISDKFGNIDPDKVAKELFDFNTLFKTSTEIYYFLTNGRCKTACITMEAFLVLYSHSMDDLIQVHNEALAEELAYHVLKDPKGEKEMGHNECLKDIINHLRENNNGREEG